jgi:hypothetical protein
MVTEKCKQLDWPNDQPIDIIVKKRIDASGITGGEAIIKSLCRMSIERQGHCVLSGGEKLGESRLCRRLYCRGDALERRLHVELNAPTRLPLLQAHSGKHLVALCRALATNHRQKPISRSI